MLHETACKEELIRPVHRRQAHALCADIDETDSPHVALVLELSGLLWTGGTRLKEGLIARRFERFYEPELPMVWPISSQ